MRVNFFHGSASPTDVQKGQRGTILIIVLWVILAISLLAVSFSAAIRTEVDAARNVVEQKQAYYAARAGIEYAVYKLMEAQSTFYQAQQSLDSPPGTVPDVLLGSVSLNLADASADVEIVDESGKLNVNFIQDFMLYNLLIMIGVDGEGADVIMDSVLDWIDADELIRPFGAESDYYLSLEQPHPAKNGFLDLPEELLLIQGITPEIYYGRKTTTDGGEAVELYGLQKYLTTFSYANRININSAPIPVLAAIPGLDYQLALMIEQMRREAPFRNVTELQEAIPGMSNEPMNYLAVLRSGIYSLRSVGHLANSNVSSQIRAVIRLSRGGQTVQTMQAEPKAYGILYWNESNTEM